MWSSGSGSMRREGFADRDAPHPRVVGDAAVQLAQERAAVAIVIFPGVLAVENDGHQRVAPGGEDAAAVLADAAQEIVAPRSRASMPE